jgi:DNA uptake protein ComE-like DNA-binding protein
VSSPPTVYGEHGRTVEPEEGEAVSSEAVATIKVNDASFTDIRRALPGIGRIAAKAIATNRPKPGGYKDFDHLLELNKAQLQGVNINWEEVKVKLEF